MTEDVELDCNHGCGRVPHRFQPSPEAGPYWRCSECGSVTVRVEEVLEWLHASGDVPDDAPRQDQQLDKLMELLDGMFDIASLDSLAASLYKRPPKPSAYNDVADEILAGVDPSRVSILLLSSLVRFTWRTRDRHPSWYGLRDRAVAEFKERVPDRWEAIMTGLLDLKPEEDVR